MKSAKPRADRRDASATPEALLNVRVIPRAPRTRVDGSRGDALLIRLAAPPVDGAANDALVAFLSKALHIPRAAVTLVAGEKSRDKRLRIIGMDQATAIARLQRRAECS